MIRHACREPPTPHGRPGAARGRAPKNARNGSTEARRQRDHVIARRGRVRRAAVRGGGRGRNRAAPSSSAFVEHEPPISSSSCSNVSGRRGCGASPGRCEIAVNCRALLFRVEPRAAGAPGEDGDAPTHPALLGQQREGPSRSPVERVDPGRRGRDRGANAHLVRGEALARNRGRSPAAPRWSQLESRLLKTRADASQQPAAALPAPRSCLAKSGATSGAGDCRDPSASCSAMPRSKAGGKCSGCIRSNGGSSNGRIPGFEEWVVGHVDEYGDEAGITDHRDCFGRSAPRNDNFSLSLRAQRSNLVAMGRTEAISRGRFPSKSERAGVKPGKNLGQRTGRRGADWRAEPPRRSCALR